MVTQKTVLIVDGDLTSRMEMAAVLSTSADISIQYASTAGAAADMLIARDSRIDGVVADGSLPDERGSALCARLRRAGVRIPILLVSGQCGEAETIAGLEAGADDYIARPFRPSEIRARLAAQIRAYERSEDAILTIGPYQFRPAQRLLQEAGTSRRIRLTEKESAVLKFLYRSSPEAVSRRVLLREVWGYSPTTSTHTVETHIYRLRQKIEPDSSEIRLLVNEDGGYRVATDWQRRGEPVRMPAERAMMAFAV